MKDVMIDIETYATRNDAAVVQIGAVAFDPLTGEVNDPFLVSVDRAFYEDVGHPFFVDERTKKWWGQQSVEARKSLDINKVATPFLAMDKLIEWFEQQEDFKIANKRRKSSRVWANPPQFDLSILRYLASKAYGSDNDVPWKHWQETDMRTLCHISGHVKIEDLPGAENLVAHRADHDAIRQALLVSEIMKRIRDAQGF